MLRRVKKAEYTDRDSKTGSAGVGQPPLLSPSASLNLFKLSCFDAGFAWLKIGAPPWHLPIFESLSVYLNGYRLKLHFDNGKVKVLDLENELKKAKNLFLDLVDIHYFKKVQCDGISIFWPNGIDFCPEWLYQNAQDLISPTQRKVRKKHSRRAVVRKRSKSKTT